MCFFIGIILMHIKLTVVMLSNIVSTISKKLVKYEVR